jgi:hypothetical protein
MSASRPRIMVISASDTRFFPYLDAMLASLRPSLAEDNVSLACLDLGLSDTDRATLAAYGAQLAVPGAHLGVAAADHSPTLRSFLARPFLRDYFPGHDVYVWIDSDIWLQDQAVFQTYVDGALRSGMAITHEREPGYRFQAWLLAWTTKHFLLGYGMTRTAHLLTRRHLNAGFFAIHADAPHWQAWAARYQAAIERTGALVPHDQFALNHALHGDPIGGPKPLDTAFLDPGCNWICDRGVPMWNDTARAFCKPYAPFAPIGALHLAGPAKRTMYDIKRTNGGSFATYILRGATPDAPITQSPLDGPALRTAA